MRYLVAAKLVLVLAETGLAPDGAAARENDIKLDQQAWGCSTLFSHYPIKTVNGEDRETALCLGEGKKGRKPMSRAEAFDLCREQFNATSLMIRWTSRGWNCRYYGR